MRTTIDMPRELHRALTSLAARNRKSFSQTAVELLQRGLQLPAADAAKAGSKPDLGPVSGLPLAHSGRVITPEDVEVLEVALSQIEWVTGREG